MESQGHAARTPVHHRVAEVGKDAGAGAGGVEAQSPINHRLIGPGPKHGVGCNEGCNLGWPEFKAGVAAGGEPVVVAGVDATVIVVARMPVGSVEGKLHPGR